MNISILYEDSDVIAINKPSGLLVHSDGRGNEETVIDWILEKYPEVEEVGETQIMSDGSIIVRPGIVHRLDAETSGVLLIAKTEDGFADLKAQFQTRSIKKEYRAFVYGVMKKDHEIINRPIGRSKSDIRLYSAQRGARGTLREAITEYTVLKRGKEYTYLSLSPHTGRTHQLRVHMKAVNYPIVCDRLYAAKYPRALGFERLALHALSITFQTLHGEQMTIEAPFPDDFRKAITSFK